MRRAYLTMPGTVFSIDVESKQRGDDASEFPVLPLDGNASGLSHHGPSKINHSKRGADLTTTMI